MRGARAAWRPLHVALLTIGFSYVGLLACRKPPEPASKVRTSAQPEGPPDPARAEPPARTFGAPAALSGAGVDVAQVLASPDDYVGQTVRCTGTVARVCQRKGCWLELRAAQGGDGLRVPMAGHAFFVPQDIVGRKATVEGDVAVEPLQPAHRAHLEGEGLSAVGPLSLSARSVTVY